MTPEGALDITVRIAAAGIAVWTLELIAIRAQFVAPGLFAPSAVRPWRPNNTSGRTHAHVLLVLMVAELVGAVALAAAGPFAGIGPGALVFVLVGYVGLRYRRGLGGEGAEQMTALILLAAAVAAIPGNSELLVKMAVCFVALQLALAYTAAGIAKAVSPVWRSGAALGLILATEGNGSRAASALLARVPRLGWLGCWAVIGFECTFVLLVLASTPTLVVALVAGFLFHLGCALLMGLNSFLWSFTAAYPCVLAAVAVAGT